MPLAQDLGTRDEALEGLADLFHIGLVEISLALLVLTAMAILLAIRWWRVGRDRWFGDSYAVTGTGRERTKPPLGHETIVVEYEPPVLPATQRSLRPAEVGLLLDERVDEVDVSATIVDLVVRKYVDIREVPRRHRLRRRDYELSHLREPDPALLPYERTLLSSLFGTNRAARLSQLRGDFYLQVGALRNALYDDASRDGLFQGNPELVRQNYTLAGAGIAGAGVGAIVLLGAAFGAGLVAAPIFLGGIALLAMSPLMPRRTALGHELYRKSLGFREYVTMAEIDRQRFAEEHNLFEEYLPYAMVFGCTRKWARAFHGLESLDDNADWYVGSTGLLPLDLAIGLAELVASLSDRHNVSQERPVKGDHARGKAL